jgi:hypothetical protein
MESYEIDLNAEDFSIDTLSKTSTMLNSGMARKMTAEDFEPLMWSELVLLAPLRLECDGLLGRRRAVLWSPA